MRNLYWPGSTNIPQGLPSFVGLSQALSSFCSHVPPQHFLHSWSVAPTNYASCPSKRSCRENGMVSKVKSLCQATEGAIGRTLTTTVSSSYSLKSSSRYNTLRKPALEVYKGMNKSAEEFRFIRNVCSWLANHKFGKYVSHHWHYLCICLGQRVDPNNSPDHLERRAIQFKYELLPRTQGKWSSHST